MEYLNIGKVVNTHGIKGELRIVSDFEYKENIFKIDNNLYIGEEKVEVKITSYRVHKNYDMVTFENYNDINEVLKFKGEFAYINRSDFDFEGILDVDIIGMKVYGEDNYIGDVTDVIKSPAHIILVIDEKHMIPYVDEYIENIDINERKINIKVVEGLLNED